MLHGNVRRIFGLVMVAAIVGTACAPAASTPPPARTDGGSGIAPMAQAERTGPPKILTVALRDEPPSLEPRMNRIAGEMRILLNAPYTYADDRETSQPLLVEKLPTQADGTWVVNPDGTMRTTYTLKPGLKWQDGQPLTAHDVAFAYRVWSDPEVPVTVRAPETFMSGVTARDDRTFDVLWKQTYVEAATLAEGDLAPLPRHLVEASYLSDKAGFVSSAFWNSTDYIGSGPFRISAWERGISLTVVANPHFVLGKPKIDTVEVKFLQEANGIVAGFLAGTIDFSAYTSINFPQAQTLRERWLSDNGGRIYTVARRGGRGVEFQFKEVANHQRVVLDRRVRAALMHAVDREGLAEALTNGFATAADTYYTKASPLFPRIDAAIAKYPFDVRRTQALLGEAGYTRAPDGLYRNAGGQTLDIDPWITSANEQQAVVVADDWKRAGFNSAPYVVPRARNDDHQFRISFPSTHITTFGDKAAGMGMTLADHPSPANGFSAGNRGSYLNPENDRLANVILTNLDPTARESAIVDIERVFTNDVGGHLYYLVDVAAGRSVLKGVKESNAIRSTYYWNVWEWTLD